MVKSSSWIVSGMVACATLVALVPMPACNDSKGYHEPSSTLRIVSVTGPKDNALTCDSRANTGACPFSVNVTFRLPAEQFVWKAYVRFQGDGDDVGVDRAFDVVGLNDAGVSGRVFGAGPETDVAVRIDTAVPPAVLGTNTQLTYSVRMVTGAGDESTEATLKLTVQEPLREQDGGVTDGGDADAT